MVNWKLLKYEIRNASKAFSVSKRLATLIFHTKLWFEDTGLLKQITHQVWNRPDTVKFMDNS